MTRWLTVKDVCDALSIHRATWYRWVKDTSIHTPEPVQGIGRMVRYPSDQFEAFLKSFEGTIGGTNDPAPQNNNNIQDINQK